LKKASDSLNLLGLQHFRPQLLSKLDQFVKYAVNSSFQGKEKITNLWTILSS